MCDMYRVVRVFSLRNLMVPTRTVSIGRILVTGHRRRRDSRDEADQEPLRAGGLTLRDPECQECGVTSDHSGLRVDGTSYPKLGDLYGPPSKRHLGVCAIHIIITVL